MKHPFCMFAKITSRTLQLAFLCDSLVLMASVSAVEPSSLNPQPTSRPGTSLECQNMKYQIKIQDKEGKVIDHDIPIVFPTSVEQLFVENYNHQFAPNIPRFEVPPSRYQDVIAFFRQRITAVQPDERTSWSSDVEMGSLQMKDRVSGEIIRVCWFSLGHGARVSLSINGSRFRTAGPQFAFDETIAIDSFMRSLLVEETKPKHSSHRPSRCKAGHKNTGNTCDR